MSARGADRHGEMMGKRCFLERVGREFHTCFVRARDKPHRSVCAVPRGGYQSRVANQRSRTGAGSRQSEQC